MVVTIFFLKLLSKSYSDAFLKDFLLWYCLVSLGVFCTDKYFIIILDIISSGSTGPKAISSLVLIDIY